MSCYRKTEVSEVMSSYPACRFYSQGLAALTDRLVDGHNQHLGTMVTVHMVGEPHCLSRSSFLSDILKILNWSNLHHIYP